MVIRQTQDGHLKVAASEVTGRNTESTEVRQGEEKNKEGDGGHRGGERGSQKWEGRERNIEGDGRKQRK